MRPQLLKVTKGPDHSFSVRRDLVPHINNRWHYHPEVELIHFKKGEGTQFIGDSVSRFKDGDVVLVGTNLPHYWRFDDVYFDEGKAAADICVAHFHETFWGDQFLLLPENKNIKLVLDKARRGIQVTGSAKEKLAGLLEQMQTANGTVRIMLLMQALIEIGNNNQLTTLASVGFKPSLAAAENDRLNAIYEYSTKNFKYPITLEDIAEVANMSPHSFCRYFKSRTRKTYSQFLIDLRVGHACKLLIENNRSLKQLYFECGFNNSTSFHKYFKIVTGKSPLAYQKEFTS